MTRVPITDTVVEQLREILTSGRLDDPHNRLGVQFAARDAGYEPLAEFIAEADASTYFEALQRAMEDPAEQNG